MSRCVAILEDDPARVVAMRDVLQSLLPRCEQHVFDRASAMIAWLGEHLGDVVLLSLDHDLPLYRDLEGTLHDFGTGRQVVDYLCTMNVTCPVIVHSANYALAPGMIACLKDAGFVHARVYPEDDTQWVTLGWADQIRTYVRDGRIAG